MNLKNLPNLRNFSKLARRIFPSSARLVAGFGLAIAVLSQSARADLVIVDDDFNNGDPASNPTGTGTGFNTAIFGAGTTTITESGTTINMQTSNDGGKRISIVSKIAATLTAGGTSFQWNGVKFSTNALNIGTGNTDRLFFFVKGNNNTATDFQGTFPTGFNIEIESDSMATGGGNGSFNGTSALVFRSAANVRTELATWHFDTLNFDSLGGAYNYTPTLNMQLTLDANNWSLAITGDTHDGGSPITFSGTYAGFVITNTVVNGFGGFFMQADHCPAVAIDRYIATQLGNTIVFLPSQILTPGYPFNTNRVFAGDLVTLSNAVQLVSGSPTYQWQRETSSGGGVFGDVSGANTPAYALNTTTLGDSLPYQYRLIVNNGNSVTGAVVTLTVDPTTVPVITQDTAPVNPSRYVGEDVTFTAAFTGNHPIGYQWQKSPDGSTWSPVTGQTGTSLYLANLQLADALFYRVEATNSSGTTDSTASQLTMLASGQKFVWSVPPVAFASLNAGQILTNLAGNLAGAAMFGGAGPVTVNMGGGYPKFQFSRDGSVATVGGGTTTGALSPVTTGDANLNAVLNGFSFDGGPKTITLSNLVVGQQYSVQLFALDNRAGSGGRQASFQDPADAADVSATILMGDNKYVVGTFTATSTTQQIQENLPTGNAGNMNALVLRAIGWNPPPYIALQPTDRGSYAGLSVTFSTLGGGAPAVAYQWMAGPAGGPYTNLVEGAKYAGVTSPNLVIKNLIADDATVKYLAVISNVNGSLTNREASLSLPYTLDFPAALIGQWLPGNTNYVDASGYSPAGTHDGYLGVGSNVRFTNDVPRGKSGSSLFFGGGTAIAISNTASSIHPATYVNDFDDKVQNRSSVAFWYKPDPATTGLAGFACLVSKRGENNQGFSIRPESGGTDGTIPVGFTLRNTSGADDVSGNINKNDGQWHHYAATWDGLFGVRRLYVDGVISLEIGNDFGPMGLASQYALLLGGKNNPATAGVIQGDSNIRGSLYDVRYYNYALDGSEVTQLAFQPPTLSISPSGANVVLTWSAGSLLESTSVTGPWTTNSAALSPYTTPATGNKFYRVQAP